MDKNSRIGILDGLRGFAALWVMLAHCMIWGGWYHLIPNPKIAVEIFMVVSGFLMVYQYRRRAEREPVKDLETAKRFWIRRFFRIAPVYYVALIFIWVMWSQQVNGYAFLQQKFPETWASHPEYNANSFSMDWRNFVVHATFLFGLIPQYCSSNLSGDWSIGLEMQFYLAFPLLFLLLRRYSWVTVVLVSLAASVAFNRLSNHFGLFVEPSFLLMKLPVFLVGMLAGEVFCGAENHELKSVAALFLASHYSMYVAAACLILLCAAYCKPGSPGAVVNRVIGVALSNPLTRFLADTSYCVYLTHGIFIAQIGSLMFQNDYFVTMRGPLRVALFSMAVAPASYFTAWIIHKAIELPGIGLGRRFIARLLPIDQAGPVSSGFGKSRSRGQPLKAASPSPSHR